MVVEPARRAIEPERRFESESVEISRKRAMSPIAIAACAGVALISGIPPLLVISAWVSLELLAWVRRSATRARPAIVSVDGAAIIVERQGRRVSVAVPSPPEAWQWPEGHQMTVFVVIRAGTASIRLRDSLEARQLLIALRVDAGEQLVGTTLTAGPVWRGAGIRRFITWQLHETAMAVALGVALLALLASILRWAYVLGWLALLALLLGIFLSSLGNSVPYRVLVGRDGLQALGFGYRHFFGYERIERVRATPFGVVLTLVDDEVVILPLSPLTKRGALLAARWADDWTTDAMRVRARRDALVAHIDTALQRWRSGTALDIAGVLERRGRSIGEWMSAVSALSEESYRDPAIGVDAIVEVLENPRSPVEQRVGAVLALRGEKDSEIGDRVRAAIESCASPELRRALECAQAGSLDEPTLDRAATTRPR